MFDVRRSMFSPVPNNLDRLKAPWYVRRRDLLSPPPERSWQALTEPGELVRWWCDAAEVDARPGGRFAFSGTSVFGDEPGALERAGNFEILDLNPPEFLEFRWWLLGVETVVRLELTSHLEQTIVQVTQSGQRSPVSELDRAQPNWWWIALPALRSHLDGDKAPLRLNYPALAEARRLRFEVGVTTFPWVIWRKLTAPSEMKRWLGGEPQIELGPGGVFQLGERPPGPQRIFELEEESRLVHDWRWKGGSVSRVEWRIEEMEGDTLLSVTDHGPWDPAANRDLLAIHWASMLLNLQRISEKGTTPLEYQDG